MLIKKNGSQTTNFCLISHVAEWWYPLSQRSSSYLVVKFIRAIWTLYFRIFKKSPWSKRWEILFSGYNWWEKLKLKIIKNDQIYLDPNKSYKSTPSNLSYWKLLYHINPVQITYTRVFIRTMKMFLGLHISSPKNWASNIPRVFLVFCVYNFFYKNCSYQLNLTHEHSEDIISCYEDF